MPLTSTEEGRNIAEQIQHQLRRLTWAVIACLVLSLAVGIFAIVLSTKISNETTRTTIALCTFRNDLASRVKQTEDYLVSHPKGFAGIPKATLVQSLHSQQRTVAALASLKCPPPTIP